jgi:hypothetical protein
MDSPGHILATKKVYLKISRLRPHHSNIAPHWQVGL